MQPVISLIAQLALALSSVDDPAPRFEAQKIDDIEIGYGLAIGDVDGDGAPDILLADKRQFVWYRNADWTRFVMVENLTKHDNVCIAARDINGDGRVEVAVGAQWNPGNTSDLAESGSVHYLMRPEDPTQTWEPVQLPHEPTVHRMRWVRGGSKYRLLVLPLHGRDNINGEGDGARGLMYDVPDDPRDEWTTRLAVDSMHLTHNFDVADLEGTFEYIIIAGREGLVTQTAHRNGKPTLFQPEGMTQGAGEVRVGRLTADRDLRKSNDQRLLIATIEPMHGDKVVAYRADGADEDKPWDRIVLDDRLAQGHALACADMLRLGRDQIVAGWRNANREGQVGIRIYVPVDQSGTNWRAHDIDVTTSGDMNGMACEDLRIADLDGDGKLDIVAAGRATRNAKIYWNRSR